MHITKVELRNFKRFTDLTIDGIPDDTKLVLLIGSNGSGKSSVFEAFERMNGATREEGYVVSDQLTGSSAIRKNKNTSEHISVSVAGNHQDLPPGSFYGRTSFRQLPRLTRTQLGSNTTIIEQDADRPRSYIDRDERFENDIEQITQRILREIFRSETSSKQLKATYIQPINDALSKIFGPNESTTLSLIDIIPPLDGRVAQITFRKGQSEIHYDYLSAGEKEVVNILFNLLIRRDQFTNTIYFFDELDLHLNTSLQFNLLSEITENWIPDNCQLWTASHSLGFIDYARQYTKGVIVDFDDLDFDQPQVLVPQPKDRLDVYDIAVPKEMLFDIMKDKKIILCENQNDEYYNLLGLPQTLFVGMKDSRSLFLQIKNDARYAGLRDRDFLSDTEIERLEKKYPNYRILRYYDFENYLYHPDNLSEVSPKDFDKVSYIQEITRQKKASFNSLLLNLRTSRSTYEELKTGEIMDKTPDSIVDDLESDEFERFYKYFDMKAVFKRTYMAKLNLETKQLVQTSWFRQQFEAILNH